MKQLTALRTCGIANECLWANERILLIKQDPHCIAKITGPNTKKWNWNPDHTMFPIYINSLQNKPINQKLRSGTCMSNGPFSHSGVRNALLVYDTETFTRVPRIWPSTNHLHILGFGIVLQIHSYAVTREPHCHVAPSAQCVWSDSFLWKGGIALIVLQIVDASVLNSVGRDLCRPDLNCNGNCACVEGLLVLNEGLCVATLRTCTTNSSVFLEGKRLDGSQRFEHRSDLVTKTKSLCGLGWGRGFVDWEPAEWKQPTNKR